MSTAIILAGSIDHVEVVQRVHCGPGTSESAENSWAVRTATEEINQEQSIRNIVREWLERD